MLENHPFIPIVDWGFGGSRPFTISGPCSAESEKQLIETALEVSKIKSVNLLRAGAWKPRTRPGAFTGKGEVALEWLSKAKELTGLPVTTEVAYPAHIESALKYGIDVLWIGARTSVNPFMVQELAEALKGIDIPVMIKNPVNPDLELWIGAIERIAQTGIRRIAAIHRGFSSYENSVYRNKPNWEIPLELRRSLPGISMICDPSHICGSTEPLSYISQFALDLNYDGLMLESHIDPGSALSDARQQLHPADLKKLIDNLILRSLEVNDVIQLSKLEDLRDEIDEVDDTIIKTLAHRMAIARNIGEYKSLNNITILQPERWDEIIRSRTRSGVEKDLTMSFLLKLYNLIHEESILQQTKMMNNKNAGGELNSKKAIQND